MIDDAFLKENIDKILSYFKRTLKVVLDRESVRSAELGDERIVLVYDGEITIPFNKKFLKYILNP